MSKLPSALEIQQEEARRFLRSAMARTGLKGAALAKRARISASTINRFLSKDVSYALEMKTIQAVAAAAEVPIPPSLLAAYGLAGTIEASGVKNRHEIVLSEAVQPTMEVVGSETIGAPDGTTFLALHSKAGPAAVFPIDRQAIEKLRNNLKSAEYWLTRFGL